MQTSEDQFISGLDLSEAFYGEQVKPIIQKYFSELSYSAALIGSGSEVLGFDTVMSTDHHWGPRVTLFLRENDLKFSAELSECLSQNLPRRFRGYPTSYLPSTAVDDAPGVQLLDYSEDGPINHRVEITTIRDFVNDYLAFDINDDMTSLDWLSIPDQKLLSITSGKVFHDEIGLSDVQSRFSYYPQDVWLYLLAAGWQRIEQEEHLMGRAATVGDELGSAIIAARLVRDLMRLCFLMERRYAPYPKWFGTAFRQLHAGPNLEPILQNALAARTWKERETCMVSAFEFVACMHNRLGITEQMPEKASLFHDRPYMVISKGAFSRSISELIKDDKLKKLAKTRLIGSVDQFSDSTDVLADSNCRKSLLSLYS